MPTFIVQLVLRPEAPEARLEPWIHRSTLHTLNGSQKTYSLPFKICLRGPGGATPRFWTPTTPPTNCWPEAPWGGGGVGGGGVGGGGGGGIGGGV